MISIDQSSQIEYWDTINYEFPKKHEEYNLLFKYKSDTDLYKLVKNKEQVIGFQLGNTGEYFAVQTRSQQIYVFEFKSGKIIQ